LLHKHIGKSERPARGFAVHSEFPRPATSNDSDIAARSRRQIIELVGFHLDGLHGGFDVFGLLSSLSHAVQTIRMVAFATGQKFIFAVRQEQGRLS
jgi:hypothetical protein